MMWSNWTNVTLILHAVALCILGVMVLNAARANHGYRWWRSWPPVLLTAWGVAELADSVIYLRRWLDQELGFRPARYDGVASLVLNTISLVAIALLIWRIRQGDIPSGETRNARDQRQQATQEVLDETSFVLAKRGKKLSDAGIDLDERIIKLGEDQRVHDAEGARQDARGVAQDARDAGYDARNVDET